MSITKIFQNLEKKYDEQVKTYGPNIRGVDWNSLEAQEIRFEQLLKIVEGTAKFSITDYGCGYGALVNFLQKKGYDFIYQGFDISREMITQGTALHGENPNCRFTINPKDLEPTDFTVASGIFNLKLNCEIPQWEDYIFKTIKIFSQISKKGFSFNMLTKYSDPDRMRQDLYYADPCQVFDFCKTKISRNVAILHDYDLFDFTILVRHLGQEN